METNVGAAHRRGGTVEPANRAAVARAEYQTPAEETSRTYELRDPFTEVTYRAKTLREIVANAEHVGALRVHEIGEDGKRRPIDKVNGQWVHRDAAVTQSPRNAQEASGPTPATKVIGISSPSASSADLAGADAEVERQARAQRIQAALTERYVVKRAPIAVGGVTIGASEYRYRGDVGRVAFTETTFRLSTDHNNPSVARSMVDVAQARNWQALRVSGHDDFKRLVWLEASVRGMKTYGYEPQLADLELVKREREARQFNRIEPASSDAPTPAAAGMAKGSGRGSGGRKAVLAVLEAVLAAKQVPPRQRDAVMAAARENLSRRLSAGQEHRVKAYDREGPTMKPSARRPVERQRGREIGTPTR